MNTCRLIFFLVCCLLNQHVAAQTPLDSAKKVLKQKDPATDDYITTCFFIADEFMDAEHYDSAQVWLNYVYKLLPAKKNSLPNYFLLTRQSEVFYYNNLQQLGLQESRRSLAMAQALKDSILIADSYNFLGLFYMNFDSLQQAVVHFYKGLQYVHQPPYPAAYRNLTMPHHLYGNLAEAYFKQKNYDSSLYFITKSLAKANEIHQTRGVAVAYAGLADALFEMGKADSARICFQKAILISHESGDIDVELISIGGLAKYHQLAGNEAAMLLTLNEGFFLLKSNSKINRFFTLVFLNTAIQLYSNNNDVENLIRAYQTKSEIDNEIIRGSNIQVRFIAEAGLVNEKRLLSMEVEEARRKQVLANTLLMMALAGIIFLVIVFFVYRRYQMQALSVSRVRHEISQDLHDEVGASLSSLQIYGMVAEKTMQSNPVKAQEMIRKISNQSRQIMETMSDIVWSMKSSTSGASTLEAKVKNYSSELLQDKNIELLATIHPEAEAALKNIHARKNILLIIKEILNNTAKHSNATTVTLDITLQEKNWVLRIKDNGTGFDQHQVNTGNGLHNIQSRAKELKGNCLVTTEKGTGYVCTFPLSELVKTGW